MTGIGLAIPAGSADDHFVAALVHSLAEPLIAEGLGLFTRVVHDNASEERMYRHWAESEGIAGVALLGAGRHDPRAGLLDMLGLPFVAVVDAGDSGDFSSIVVDVAASVTVVADFLQGRGHDRVVYIVGPTDSFTARSRAAVASERFEVVNTDRASDAAVIAALSVVEKEPATLLFDSDVHAAAVLAAFSARGIRVPDDVAIVSWTDSSLCRSTSPSITAVNRRGSEIGALLGARMLKAVDGAPAGSDDAPHPFVVLREST
ncbi:substrate-binding domain-containing protein [Microbacterium sp. SA39]|uniref:substrate-binding domain-containing protein n=1 Tax=Microbacterium sp. SA39 TaxID=1263625 RepID=UPI00061E2E5A|nr:substrate-binding domain-containing protein [Microbacterium sp. SA39]KJQ52775.1 HTH-type transcriptional repressor PurR [Microbacterium sp. SA39]